MNRDPICEVFATAIRSRSQSLGGSTPWFRQAVIETVFPLVAAASTPVPFGFCSGMSAVQRMIVLLYFPETKRAALEDKQAAIQ